MKQVVRINRLLPAGVPKYVRCYDNGGRTFDRYTVVFTGNYAGRIECDYVGMSDHPCHPQGFCIHASSPSIIDKPTYSHLGKKIQFSQLPFDCQSLVLSDYKELWNL